MPPMVTASSDEVAPCTPVVGPVMKPRFVKVQWGHGGDTTTGTTSTTTPATSAVVKADLAEELRQIINGSTSISQVCAHCQCGLSHCVCDDGANAADEEQIAQIEGAFEDLYRGILAEREGQFAEQRDGIGRPYILAADLRNLLVTTGESMTDEEADQLIADCKPIYKVQADGTVTGKIFFEQYRSMLLPGPN